MVKKYLKIVIYGFLLMVLIFLFRKILDMIKWFKIRLIMIYDVKEFFKFLVFILNL